MFIRFFRNSYIQQYIVFFVFAIALWIPTFLNPPYIAAQNPSSPLYNLLIQLTQSKFIWAILAFVLLLLQSLFFNLILTNNEFIRKTSLLGSFIYFTFMSHHASFQHFSPALMSHFFILFTIYFSLNMYGKEDVLRDSFRLGFYIGLASLLYLPSIFFLALIFSTLLLFRVTYWRQWIIPIFSFLTPYLFLFTYYFVSDKLYIFKSYFHNFLNGISINWPYDGMLSIIISIAYGIIILISFLHLMGRKHEKNLYFRKKTTFFIYLLIISIVSLLVSTESMISFTTYIIPISFIVAVFFNNIKKLIWVDVFFSITIILMLINLY